MALDERLRRELERTASPADPSGVYEHLIRRRERRRLVRRIQTAGLTLVVITGSVVGFYGLTRVFEGREPERAGSVAVSNGPITVVQHDGSESSSIFSVERDGSGRVDLVHADGLVTELDWSPDGRRLVYGRGDLFVLDLDEGTTTKLNESGTLGFAPSWSPDGSRVAFAVERSSGNAIYVANADGTDATILYEATDLGWTDWSPDGTRMLFVGPGPAGVDQGWDIYLMNADGSGVTNLTNSEAVDLDPSWSPDGSTILFRSRGDLLPARTDADGDSLDELYLMAPNGGDVRRLTNDDAVDQSPVWSPDGHWIAFTSYRPSGNEGNPAVYTMRPDGTDRTSVPGIWATAIAWQPLPDNGSVVPEPTPSETPTESLAPENVVDIGLGFPVCTVTSVSGTFAPETAGTAYVATKVGDTGGCPESGFQMVAVDLTGDSLVDASYGPVECDRTCSAFAAPDVNGDGIDELFVQNIEFSIAGLRLYEVRADPPEILPVTVSGPGYPEGGFPPGVEPQWWLGGDGFRLDTLRCFATGSIPGRVLIQTSASQVPPDSPDFVWRATATWFDLNADGTVTFVDVGTFDEPVDEDGPTFAQGDGLCGARLPYPYGGA